MIIVHSTFHLESEFRDAAIEQMKHMATLCVAEHGCLSYEYFQGLTDPNQVVLLQEWENEKSLQAHYQTEHMSVFVSKLGQYMESGVTSRSFVSQEEKFASTAEEDVATPGRIVH